MTKTILQNMQFQRRVENIQKRLSSVIIEYDSNGMHSQMKLSRMQHPFKEGASKIKEP